MYMAAETDRLFKKALGIDGVTAEIVKLGEEPLCSATLQLYRAILRSGRIPEN